MQSIVAGFMRLSNTIGHHRISRYVMRLKMSDEDTDGCDGLFDRLF